MALKLVYDSQDDIPEKYRDLYTEQDGKFTLTGVEGIKTQGDVDRLQEALRKEKNDHKKAKDRLKLFGDLDPEEVHEKLDKYDELEAAAAAADNPEKVQELVDAKIKTITAPLERDLGKAQERVKELETQNEKLNGDLTSRIKGDAIRSAALEAKVVPSALDDILTIAGNHMEITEEGKVVTAENSPLGAGLDPKAYFQEMADKRPHWFPASSGGGSRGGNGTEGFANNPWSRDNWNMTRQGEILSQDRSKAERMAQAAGTRIGGPMPAAPKSQ